jgi:uncharacterized protein
MNEKVSRILSELKNRLQAVYGHRLASIVLFGSQARGEALSDSDIDILLVFQGAVDRAQEKEKVMELTSELSLENDAVISCLYMPEERFLHEDSPLLRNIRQEGVMF